MKIVIKIYILISIVILYYILGIWNNNFINLKSLKEWNCSEFLLQKEVLMDVLTSNMTWFLILGTYVIIGIIINITIFILYNKKMKSVK
ncbi:hypothetical protein D0T84_19900 [Dysgonomonas sp. 521]|nr:hypothetical protein [Dysgonomonas sp. 521]